MKKDLKLGGKQVKQASTINKEIDKNFHLNRQEMLAEKYKGGRTRPERNNNKFLHQDLP